MSSSMLEQAIIDAKELKESAQKNAEEAIVEKYQIEIKEAVEKILEQDDLGLGGDLGAPGALGAPGGKPMSAKQPEAGKDQVDMVLNQLPFIQTTGEDEIIELDLGKLEESLNIVNEGEFDITDEEEPEEELTIDDDLLDEYMLEEEFLDEEFELDEEMLDEEVTAEEAEEAEKTLAAYGSQMTKEGLSLEEMIAEALEDMLSEDDDVLEEEEDLFEVEDLEEEKIKNPGKYAGGPRAKAGVDDDGDGVPNKADKDPKDGAVQESKKLQKENKTLIKEQTRMSSKVQLLEEKLDKYGTVIEQLKQKLDESNLASAKLLYQNRVLDSVSLNERQKNRIVEAIKDAGTVEEAKIIFETLQSTVETTGKSGRKRESLDEVVYRGSSAFMPLKEEKQKVSDPFVARMQALAGLK